MFARAQQEQPEDVGVRLARAAVEVSKREGETEIGSEKASGCPAFCGRRLPRRLPPAACCQPWQSSDSFDTLYDTLPSPGVIPSFLLPTYLVLSLPELSCRLAHVTYPFTFVSVTFMSPYPLSFG